MLSKERGEPPSNDCTDSMNFTFVSVIRIQFKSHAVPSLVESLFYKPEGRGLESRWGHWIYQLT
jgi:hypothetical protein